MIRWFRGRTSGEDKKRHHWRTACSSAIESEDATRLGELRSQMDHLGNGDVEIELEMLDALERVDEFRKETAAGTLPLVETHHRVIGVERCHFTAPASVPDDPAQPSGRVLFTPTRSLFVSAGKTSITPWHAVQHVVRTDRDLLLARADGASGAVFRFNSFGDAAVAAALARRLKGTRPTRAV